MPKGPSSTKSSHGITQPGRLAMSANALPGSNRTPAIREASPIPFGCGSGGRAISGVISVRLYRVRARLQSRFVPPPKDAQSFSVKRAQVEFHNFASLGEPERAIAGYLDENVRRASVIKAHRDFIGPMSPFLEIGANAGHTSYMLANQFGGEGFALDISADALRHGIALINRWNLSRAPVRVAGDAVNLPFRDNSIRFVMACQMLSQFMNIESVFLEVKRVLAPGGVFLFT